MQLRAKWQQGHAASSVKIKQTAGKLALTLLLIGFGILMVLPFLWMLSTSFKKPIDVFAYPIQWIPESFNWNNYVRVWNGPQPFWLYYYNSIKVTVLTVLGTVVVCSAAAYGFARIHFKGRDALFFMFLATLMIPDQVTLVPRFIIFNWDRSV